MAKFDLHLHTNNSDGSDSTSELIRKVTSVGIDIFAITDHDTIEGVTEAEKIIPKDKIFITGVELTSKARNIKCHILGYGFDTNNEGLKNLISKGKVLRKQKLEKRISYLKEVWDIELTEKEINWLYSRKSVVKTHIANILVNRGLASDNVFAMKKYLDGCKTGNTRFNGEEAIMIIKKAGGIAVWAHPLGGEGEVHLTEQEFIPKLKTMTDCGIQGLECFYSRYNSDEINFLIECAYKYNLSVSGGSDYHGTNKTVPLGRLNIDDIAVESDRISILNRLSKGA